MCIVNGLVYPLNVLVRYPFLDCGPLTNLNFILNLRLFFLYCCYSLLVIYENVNVFIELILGNCKEGLILYFVSFLITYHIF